MTLPPLCCIASLLSSDSARVREYQLQPLRTELTVAWVAGDMVVTAGQIDSIWIDKNGRLYMIDWKRSQKPVQHVHVCAVTVVLERHVAARRGR